MRYRENNQRSKSNFLCCQIQVLPSNVSDVLVTCSMASVPVQVHGAGGGRGGRLTPDGGLVVLSRLDDSRDVCVIKETSFRTLHKVPQKHPS